MSGNESLEIIFSREKLQTRLILHFGILLGQCVDVRLLYALVRDDIHLVNEIAPALEQKQCNLKETGVGHAEER